MSDDPHKTKGDIKPETKAGQTHNWNGPKFHPIVEKRLDAALSKSLREGAL